MRLYGGRTLKNKTDRRIADSRELRDAVVWTVYPDDKYCMVKVQGSDTLVKAWYNENWESTPQWLKAGNAVRITHPGGNKGRIEVAGHGFLIPTSVTGTPSEATPGDTVLTGLNITASSPSSMSVSISTGTYRIDGVTYTLGAIQMDRSDIEMDRLDITMDGTGDVVFFDAASATLFRYDMIVVGTDGVADVVKGTEASSDPEMPSLPADHVMAGWVFIYPGMTGITVADINRYYSDPDPTELRIVIEDDDLAWGDTLTYFTISVRDQYGRILSGTYFVTVTFNSGNGTLSYGSSSSTTALTVTFTGTVNIFYTRDGLDPGDESPTFTIEEEVTTLSGLAYVMLKDSAGELML